MTRLAVRPVDRPAKTKGLQPRLAAAKAFPSGWCPADSAPNWRALGFRAILWAHCSPRGPSDSGPETPTCACHCASHAFQTNPSSSSRSICCRPSFPHRLARQLPHDPPVEIGVLLRGGRPAVAMFLPVPGQAQVRRVPLDLGFAFQVGPHRAADPRLGLLVNDRLPQESQAIEALDAVFASCLAVAGRVGCGPSCPGPYSPSTASIRGNDRTCS